MRVVAVGPWDRPGWAAALEAAGHEVIEGRSIERFPGLKYSEAELIELVGEADAVLVSSRDPMTRRIIEACPRLRIIAKATIGVEVIDLDAATDRAIVRMARDEHGSGNTIQRRRDRVEQRAPLGIDLAAARRE